MYRIVRLLAPVGERLWVESALRRMGLQISSAEDMFVREGRLPVLPPGLHVKENMPGHHKEGFWLSDRVLFYETDQEHHTCGEVIVIAEPLNVDAEAMPLRTNRPHARLEPVA